jgi:hypothetical protein
MNEPFALNSNQIENNNNSANETPKMSLQNFYKNDP